MRKIIYILVLVSSGFLSCEVEKDEDSSDSTTMDYYTLTVKGSNSIVSYLVGYNVTLGTKDSGINSDFQTGCQNLGTKELGLDGTCTFITTSLYAGKPNVCELLLEGYTIDNYNYNSTTGLITFVK